MLIAGCDPGLDGAIAFLDATTMRFAAVLGMPAMKLGKGKGTKREISIRTLMIGIERENVGSVGLVFLERVSSSPQMGVTSSFQFGRCYGAIEGAIAALGWPIEYVTPAKWKKALGVPAEKDDARNRATQLLASDAALWTPQRGVMNKEQASGRADAALIALYGVWTLAGIVTGKRPASSSFVLSSSVPSHVLKATAAGNAER